MKAHSVPSRQRASTSMRCIAHSTMHRKPSFKELGWNSTGKFCACPDCNASNAKQKGVNKATDVKSERPGERIFTDIVSIKHPSLGGGKFWLAVADDATGVTRSFILKQKNHLHKKMIQFLLELKADETPCSCIQCNDAGENKSLETECKNNSDLAGIELEHTKEIHPNATARQKGRQLH